MTSFKRFGMLWLVAVAFSSFAQFVSVTPKVGMGISTGHLYFGSPFKGQRFAPKFGLATEYRLSDKYALKAELFWNQQRYVLEGMFIDDSGTTSHYGKLIVRPSLLDIPLSLQKNFGHNRNWFWSVGTYTSYLLGTSTVFESGSIREVSRGKLSGANRFLWGLSTGFGVKLPVSDKNKILIELRANWYRYGGRSSTSSFGNRLDASFWLLVGYEFGRKKG
jgi:hypothetical protein